MQLNEDRRGKLSALQIDVVLFNIFKFLCTKDLKSCRLVCQNWRYSSQGIFRKRVVVIFQNTESPLHIRFFGKGLKPSTTNFMHTFDCEEVPSDTYYFYNEAWNWGDHTNCRFLLHYGKTIRNFKAVAKERSNAISVEEILSFRHKLLMLMPNIEQLSLKITLSELHPRSTTFSVVNCEVDCADSFANVQLVSLKRLSVCIGSEGSQPLSDQQKKITTNVFSDIIKRTKRLESLNINACPAMMEMMDQLPKESFRSLRHFRLTDWKSYNYDADNMLKLLSELTNKKALTLVSFSAHFEFANCEDDHVKTCIRSLLCFLNCQKNHLQNLSIHFPKFIGNGHRLAHILEDDRSGYCFPKMLKLSSLNLHHSQRVLLHLFKDCEVWTKLFPQLKILDYKLNYNDRDVEELSIYPTISKIECNSLSEITITMIQDPVVSYGSKIVTSKDFYELYDMSKGIFPNLKTFKIKHINGEEIYDFSNHDIFPIGNQNRFHGHDGDDDYDDEGDEDPDRRFQESDFFDSQFDYYYYGEFDDDIDDDMDMLQSLAL